MGRTASILWGIGVLVVCGVLASAFVWTTMRKSEDPGRILFKWIASGVILILLLAVGAGLQKGDPASAFIVPITGAVLGVVLGILWAPHLGALIARPFTSFYDGGGTEVEERPFYSIARAKLKQGHYDASIAEVQKQLEKFPEDYEGWMLLAEIHGNHLKDNHSAQACLNEILSHKGHAPKNIVYALNRGADWHLGLSSDREAARVSLERIIDLFPATDFAHSAAQRVAHLTSDKMLAEQKERSRILLTRHEEHIGLRGEIATPKPREEAPEEAAHRLVNHLADHPNDTEAREELARIYARHYRRMDLAADQLEQLMASPGVGQKQVAKWLNMLADLHLEVGPDRVSAEASLRRIMETYPDSAVATNAEMRLAYLDHEMRKSHTSRAIKLGSYEQDIGLKGSLPARGSGPSAD